MPPKDPFEMEYTAPQWESPYSGPPKTTSPDMGYGGPGSGEFQTTSAAPAGPDMSGYVDDPNKWMQESGGSMEDYNREMARWRGEPAPSAAPAGGGGAPPAGGGNTRQGQAQPGQQVMDYNTWLAQARAEAERRGEPFNEAGAQDQYEAYKYNAEHGMGGVDPTAQQSGGAWGQGFSAQGAPDATGMREIARQRGFSEDFDRFDEGTLMSWEKYKDERCPPHAPYAAMDGSGCVEKPIDTNHNASLAQPVGGTPGTPGGGGGPGGGPGGGGGAGGGYGLQGGWDQGLTAMYKEAMSGKDGGQLFEMMGGGAEYSKAMDNLRAQIATMEEGPAKEAAKQRLAEMEATGEMSIKSAARMTGLQSLQGLIPLHQDAWKFSNQLRENARQFNQSLDWDKSKFGQTMAWDRERFGRSMAWEQDRFAQSMDFQRWATQGDWDNSLQLAQMKIDAEKGSFWDSLGGLLGGAAGSIFGPAGSALGGWLGETVQGWLPGGGQDKG